MTSEFNEVARTQAHQQIPIVRAQIRSLRRLSDEAHRAFERNTSNHDDIGELVNSVMLAGFALELGLKTFMMTWSSNGRRGHNLVTLFKRLPPQMQGDIEASFAASSFSKSEVMSVGLKFAPAQPVVDIPVPASDFRTAEGVLWHAARAFEQVRYFFEKVSSDQWAVLTDATHYMLALSEVLDVVCDAYLERGGWAE